jgi:RHH-type proline utilization regulon transcriptional repressor/proline dehydrogenase/delta 1-pyrroline-5-carboxylate dehydrogenase
VEPRQIGANPNLWSPGVKWGVLPGSFMHLTELFGPVLGVMRFTTLAEAITLVNATGYGLTSGLESLDDREQAQWLAGIRAGNLYLNRPTTGAIVLRQPFGGMGRSCFGPGMKAGGPNYVAQFMRFTDRAGTRVDALIAHPQLAELAARIANSPDAADIIDALASYDAAARCEFLREHDHFRLLGQDNRRRYLPIREVRVRVEARDSFFEIFARAGAARAAGCRVIMSSPPGEPLPAVRALDDLTDSWAGDIEFIEESSAQLGSVIRAGEVERIRFAAPDRVAPELRSAAAESGVYLADAPVLREGRLELLWYLREQSISHDYHRYGNLGARAAETRQQPK